MTSSSSLTDRIDATDYSVQFSAANASVVMQGSLRLNAAPEYEPIEQLLDRALAIAGDGATSLTLDVQALKFLNSSGINLLYQFVLRVKKQASVHFKVVGSSANAWQPKSLSNMVKFMPTLELVIT